MGTAFRTGWRCLVAGVLAAGVATAAGQEGGGAEGNPDPRAAARQEAARRNEAARAELEERRQRVSVDFGGGTVQEYVVALQAASRGTANVIVSNKAAGLALPRITLVGVEIGTALEAMRYAIPDAEAGYLQVFPIGARDRDRAPQAWGIVHARDRSSVREAPEQQDFQAISLREVIEGEGSLAADVVLTAVETALRMHGGEDAEVKFHDDSGLLLVRGPDGAVRGVEMVVATMRSDVARVRGESRQSREMGAALEAERKKARVKAELARARVEHADRRVHEISRMRESGQASVLDLAEAEMAARQAHAEYQMMQIDAERLEEAGPPRSGDGPAGRRRPGGGQ